MTRPDNPAPAPLLDRLQAGETPAEVRRSLDLGPAEFLLALGVAAFGHDDEADGPGLVRGGPRRPWLAPALDESSWSAAFPGSNLPARLAVAAGLFQVHDFWDASHDAAQRADDLGERGSSAYWHAIAHRREPDPGNAGYWFRRVARHPSLDALAREARPLLDAHGDHALTARLIKDGTWDPFAFVDLCTAARSGSDVHALAMRIQRLEMTRLLEATIHAL